MLKVLADAYVAADTGYVTLLSLLDLSAAFDTVDHSILVERLRRSNGIVGRALDWLKSYLTGRSQFVRFNGEVSATTPVTCGVPQGSVLGPVLFLLYAAGVINLVEECGFSAHAYADDLQVYQHVSPAQSSELLEQMANCVSRVEAWMVSNRLRLNPAKTEVIWLGSSRRLAQCPADPLILPGASIQPVSCVRDLGVVVDQDLSLASHVSHVTSVCFFHLRQLRLVRRSLTIDTAHALVRALIHSRLDYCNGVFAGLPAGLFNRLQSVLRASARLVLGLPGRAPVMSAIRDTLHWLSYPQRVTFKLCLTTYKCLHGLAPPYLTRFCTPLSAVAGRTHLRSADQHKLFVPRTSTSTFGSRAFSSSSPLSWNALPPQLRDPAISISISRQSLTRGQSNLTKIASWGTHSPVSGHPRG